MAVAGFVDALLPVAISALIGGGGQPSQRPDLSPITKLPPAEKLFDVQPGTVDPDAPQTQQLPHHLRLPISV
jgi:hypothetical protein